MHEGAQERGSDRIVGIFLCNFRDEMKGQNKKILAFILSTLVRVFGWESLDVQQLWWQMTVGGGGRGGGN